MSAKILDGVALGRTIRAEVAAEVARLAGNGRKPGLAAVLVGEDPASAVYVRSKGKATQEAGMHSETIRQPATVTEDELLAIVDRLNADLKIHGILVQLPLPKHIDSEKVLHRIDPAKDVDGFHPVNAGLLRLGYEGFLPATAHAAVEILRRSGIEIEGRRAKRGSVALEVKA